MKKNKNKWIGLLMVGFLLLVAGFLIIYLKKQGIIGAETNSSVDATTDQLVRIHLASLPTVPIKIAINGQEHNLPANIRVRADESVTIQSKDALNYGYEEFGQVLLPPVQDDTAVSFELSLAPDVIEGSPIDEANTPPDNKSPIQEKAPLVALLPYESDSPAEGETWYPFSIDYKIGGSDVVYTVVILDALDDESDPLNPARVVESAHKAVEWMRANGENPETALIEWTRTSDPLTPLDPFSLIES